MLLRSPRLQPGFTLIEIMVVMFIVSLLLAIAVPQFIRAREVSRATSCRHNLKQILGSKERWAMDNHKGPDDEPVMEDLVEPGVYLEGELECPSGGDYDIGKLSELPTCTIGGVNGDRLAHLLP
jgi:prepilin-type N-terminal cleavage/methylation domain-containing protein